jgi:hypothetical protein
MVQALIAGLGGGDKDPQILLHHRLSQKFPEVSGSEGQIPLVLREGSFGVEDSPFRPVSRSLLVLYFSHTISTIAR